VERVRGILEGRLGPYAGERRYVREDGSRVWAKLTFSPVRRSSGEPDYFICVVEDVTPRKLKELVPDPLTPREIEILRLVAAGRTNPEIARCLAHSLGTVKLCVQRIIAKLGVECRAQAAAWAIEIGLIPPPTAGAP
jgi:DNA-binding NarL/FixJ family response regulator